MDIIRILLQKEAIVFKNSHLRNREQIYISLVLLILGLLAIGGITWFMLGRIQPLLAPHLPAEAKNLIINSFLPSFNDALGFICRFINNVLRESNQILPFT